MYILSILYIDIYTPYSCLRTPHVSICCEAEGPDKDDAQLRAELLPQNGCWMGLVSWFSVACEPRISGISGMSGMSSCLDWDWCLPTLSKPSQGFRKPLKVLLQLVRNLRRLRGGKIHPQAAPQRELLACDTSGSGWQRVVEAAWSQCFSIVFGQAREGAGRHWFAAGVSGHFALIKALLKALRLDMVSVSELRVRVRSLSHWDLGQRCSCWCLCVKVLQKWMLVK